MHAGANQSPLGAELQLVTCAEAVAVELLEYLARELGSRELVKLCDSMGRAVRVRGWPSCWSYDLGLGAVAACPAAWRGQGSWVCSVHADSLASDGASRRKGHARMRAGLGVSRGGLADCVVCWALPCWGAWKGKTRWVDGVLGQGYAMGPVALEVGDGVSRE